MLQRIGITIDDSDLKHLQLLQKRFGVRSRSELFRELVKRYEKMERHLAALTQCLEGYTKNPETSAEAGFILRDTLKHQPSEDWQ